MSYNYSYAKLGQSCQTSMDILTDNKKFFPINSSVYKIGLTKMSQLPVAYFEKDFSKNENETQPSSSDEKK